MARAKIVERLGDDFWKRRIEGPLGQKPPREVLDLVTHTLCDGTAGDRSLLWLCAVLLDLRVCGKCGLPEVSESSGLCVSCGALAGKRVLHALQRGIALAQRTQLRPLWRACAKFDFGAVLPELERLSLTYSLRENGSALSTLREQTQYRQSTLLWLRTRQDDSMECQSPHFLGAFIPFAWPWKKQQSRADDKALAQKLLIFYVYVQEGGIPVATLWPLLASDLRPWDLMRVSVRGGLLIGGTSTFTAALSLGEDLRHGRLTLPSQVFREGFGEGAPKRVSQQSWNFDVVDAQIWALPEEESMEEGMLPFEFEYRNNALNKRIMKTVLGGIATGLLR